MVLLMPAEMNKMARTKPNYEYKAKFTVTEYLCTYSKKRNLDNAFIIWCRKKDNSNPAKTIEEWDLIIKEFLNEV